jgi:3-methyladenine DNA glycosylase AlkD
MEPQRYVSELIRKHEPLASPYNAPVMERYMKNRFPFFGIHSPQRKEILKNHIQDCGYPAISGIETVVKLLWDSPQRELQYSAQEILSRKIYLDDPERINLIEFLIVSKSWWDTVDYIASNIAGPWFKKHPEAIIPVTGRWISSDNLWLKRSAILFQLKYKANTDEELLYEYISGLKNESDFFIRKAIGWALREYAKTNPLSVKIFVSNQKLSTLSIREALKHFGDNGKEDF